ncbi:MAG: prolipoprotein diacylglyceryl transferase [Gammaproteobacteria bacterium]|jgi:phosphatidylglycerol:prolipoprotein diacylglycerol transferase|nr:prolipoprotein diacylglyceryl transferase [Gammaproteobacteria bacterium]HUV20981.1 prolipoprotein diacylglyceryl transferase [Gammaproteobacteria bacterium]
MIAYPSIDPVALSLGPLKIHWYGIMYLIAFGSAWWLGKLRAERQEHAPVKPTQIDDLIFYGALGAVLGGRLGSVIFYNFDSFLHNPMYLFKIWEGGMSFHGGFIGVLLAMELYRRKLGCRFWELTDFIAPLVPLGLAAGRLGNFINAELWGAPSTLPWAIKLSCERFAPDRYVDFAGPLCFSARHPSQLYEMLFEGVLLFVALWLISARRRPVMTVSGWFLLLYGIARSGVELIRLPDAHIGYLMNTDWLTRGIVLSLPMIIVGIILLVLAKRSADNAAIS